MQSDQLKVLAISNLLSKETPEVAKYLLGKYLISTIDNNEIICRIVETEAYRAPEDKASHAYQNKKTERTKFMFEKAGISYVYLCYGIHHMLNVVTGPKGYAHAVLIRAVEPLTGIDHILQRRNITLSAKLTNGPGKLCHALGIRYQYHNAIHLCDKSSMLWLADNDSIDKHQILSGPRVGVAYAEESAHWPWRYQIKDNNWTSSPMLVNY